ncbi:MAG: alcohol dehydrogenase catalytic domain-containing protein [Kiritimatiellia bacterium]|nr:alcohol dehydrogenase catalytic domain-containing protein [Kiritimatiellia bacterium]MDP6810017.1 alcohol dehydrogenase catalytic domain-containing protein [Kiritimatiellia bacterium]MDP7024788.1 alcohol dehydrogenase catalytic domain-containing protein [Kiritimatiellia bacterium]
MRQAVMTAPGTIEFRDVDAPHPGPGQVRIRIERIGVCGSDIHVFHGKHPFVTYPLVQGHEYAGVIDTVGDGVEGIQVGDKVTATPQEVCGICPPCRRGQYNACEELKVRGFQAPGCAQDYFVTEADKIIALPADFKPEQGAFVEPVAVAAHSTGQAGGDLSGKNVVVSGAGTIGNFVAQACMCRGAKKVLITDISDYRLDVARQVGISATCNVSKEPFVDAVRREFGADGFDIGAEVAGVEASLSALVANIGKGGTLLSIGVFEAQPRVDMSVVCEHELTVRGSMMYRHEDFEQAVAWIADGSIVTEPLVSGHFPFEQYEAAYQFIEEKADTTLKVVIDLD